MTASPPRSILPPLTAEEAAHSAQLGARIAAEVQARGGWLDFERFMELALYAPGLGYYSAGARKLGPGGDFVTAPEVSELFGRCLARQCSEVLAVSGGDILELGAGTGRLAGQLLRELERLGSLPERYAILEVSADLAARQREYLKQLPAALRARLVWLERLPEASLNGVILANEVADALPCRRFVTHGTELLELGVALEASAPAAAAFCWQAATPAAALARAFAELSAALPEALPEGYTSEVCLCLTPWITTLATLLARGLLLICDYGLPRRHYYHRERTRGTLTCHFRQRAHTDPLIYPGLQDITAWVDFTRVAEAGTGAGLELAGFATQAAVLVALGIEELVGAADDALSRARLAGEARRLLMPEEMGEAFKMMALTRGLSAPLTGFGLQDLCRLL
jgi:SAM-dependent MidA family methyltransferase